MKALTYDRYGGIEELHLAEVAPVVAGRGEVLVRVHAAGLNPKDALVRKGKYAALSGGVFPKIPGLDFAGTVAALGPGASDVAPGDRVFGALREWSFQRGTFAEKVVVKRTELARMPDGLSFEDAASLPLAGQTALQALRDLAGVRPGDEVLVNGGSGGVGTLAIQIAKALGARVTSVSSAANRKLCRSLGADVALDYKGSPSPFEKTETRYRVVFDVYGNKTRAKVKRVLEPRGVYVTTVPSRAVYGEVVLSFLGAGKTRVVVVKSRSKDIEALSRLVVEGRLKAVLDRVLPFEEFAEAFRHIESRRAKGKIVLRMRNEGGAQPS